MLDTWCPLRLDKMPLSALINRILANFQHHLKSTADFTPGFVVFVYNDY